MQDQGKKGTCVTEQAMKINKIKAKENHSTTSGSVERALSSLWLAGSLPEPVSPSINSKLGHKPDPRGPLGR